MVAPHFLLIFAVAFGVVAAVWWIGGALERRAVRRARCKVSKAHRNSDLPPACFSTAVQPTWKG